MDVREKLVELIDIGSGCPDGMNPFGDSCESCRYKESTRCELERLADHLISNGVTVQGDELPTNCKQLWIPVTERLPETCGYPVLMVAVNKYGQKKIVKGFTSYECPVEFCTNEKEYDLCWHCWEVTHWMPLPEPPKGEQ